MVLYVYPVLFCFCCFFVIISFVYPVIYLTSVCVTMYVSIADFYVPLYVLIIIRIIIIII